jgi:hypothetical protein
VTDAAARDALTQRWLHSREEDSGNQIVYRPATYEFPPARGRTGFELRPDGSMIDIGIGPTDRRAEASGTWSLAGDRLILRGSAGATSERSTRILAVSPERLVLEG